MRITSNILVHNKKQSRFSISVFITLEMVFYVRETDRENTTTFTNVCDHNTTQQIEGAEAEMLPIFIMGKERERGHIIISESIKAFIASELSIYQRMNLKVSTVVRYITWQYGVLHL